MSKNENELVGWVTATCKNKKCQKVFMIFDRFGKYNDEPTTDFYCPECEHNGFKNTRNKKNIKPTPLMFLNKNKIKDKIIRREFLKICKSRGKNRTYESILKEAIEVASYYNESEV